MSLSFVSFVPSCRSKGGGVYTQDFHLCNSQELMKRKKEKKKSLIISHGSCFNLTLSFAVVWPIFSSFTESAPCVRVLCVRMRMCVGRQNSTRDTAGVSDPIVGSR